MPHTLVVKVVSSPHVLQERGKVPAGVGTEEAEQESFAVLVPVSPLTAYIQSKIDCEDRK